VTAAAAPTARVGRARAWVLAARPATLVVGLAPVLVGAAAAGPAARPGPIAAALAGALAIQIGTNFANDVFDAEKGADTAARVGPTRAVQSGLLSARAMRAGMALAFAAATAVGVYLAFCGGPAVVAIGLASIAAGIAYTGGPWPLGYHGLGDAFVFAFFGPVAVCGTALVASGAVPPAAAVASAAVGALATAVLVVNNVRDAATDAAARKRTLVVRFGRRFGIAEYAGLLGLAYAACTALAFGVGGAAESTGGTRRWALLPLLTAPWAVALARRVARVEGAALNPLLGATARLLLAFAALLALGLRAEG